MGRAAALWVGLAVAAVALLVAWWVEARTRRELAERYAVLVEGGERTNRELELLRDEREPLVLSARAAEANAVALGRARRERYAARVAAAALAVGLQAPERARELLEETALEERGFEWGALALAAELVAPVVREHETRLSAVALSPDGAWLASADEDGELWIGPASSDEDAELYVLGEEVVYDLAFDPAGERVAAATGEGFVHVIDVEAGEEVALLVGHDGPVLALAFGEQLYSAGEDGAVRGWNVEEERELFSFEPCSGELVDLAVNDAQGYLLVGSDEGELALYHTLTRELRHDYSDERERWLAVAAAAQGRELLAGGEGRIATVLDGFEGGRMGALSGPVEAITDLWLSGDGARALVATRSGEVRQYDVASGLELARLDAGERGVERIAVDALGGKVAFFTANEERVRLWERPAPRAHTRVEGSDSTATALVADAAGERWFTGRSDGSVLVASPPEGALATRRVLSTTVRAIALSPDEASIAVGAADGAVRLLDSSTLAELRAFEGHEQRVVDLRFTADGARLASASAAGVFKLWDVESGELVSEKPGPRQWVLASAISRDGRFGLWVAGGGVVRMWELASGARAGGFRELELGRVTAIALSPDTRRLVTVTNQHRLRVFDVQTGALLGEAPARPDLAVCVTISPDGRRFASGGVDGAVRLFELDGAIELTTLPGSDVQVYGLAYSPDGRRLAASLAGGALEIWESAIEDWRAGR